MTPRLSDRRTGTGVGMSKYTFNNIEYEITEKDGWFDITREDGKSLGSSAAFHNAVYACTLDAFPQEPRRTLRKRP